MVRCAGRNKKTCIFSLDIVTAFLMLAGTNKLITEIIVEDIKAFLRSKEHDIGFEDKSVDALLANKSMRNVEIPWVILQFQSIGNPEKVLDLGISFFDRKYFKLFWGNVILPSKEFQAIDIVPFDPERFSCYVATELLKENIKFQRADIRAMPCTSNYFDVIFCISTIEHVGFDKVNMTTGTSAFDRSACLPKKLPDVESWTEDFKAMEEIIRILKPGGKLLLTVPFGQERIIIEKDSLGLYALELQYDKKRLQRLESISGLKIARKKVFVYDRKCGWSDKIPEIIPSKRKAVACLEIEKV